MNRRNFLSLLGAALVASAIPVAPDIAMVEAERWKIYTVTMTIEEVCGQWKVVKWITDGPQAESHPEDNMWFRELPSD